MNQPKLIHIEKLLCSMVKKFKSIFWILPARRNMMVGDEFLFDQIHSASSSSAIRDTYIRSGEGFLLVFDVTDAESFTDVKEL
jgi:GTPase SAR1 family protein